MSPLLYSRTFTRLTLGLVAIAALGVGARAVGRLMEGPEGEVRRVWLRYFESKDRDLKTGAAVPSALWDAAEQAQWPTYDLAGLYVPAGAIPTVREVVPLPGAAGIDYEIVVDFLNVPLGGDPPQGAIPVTATWRVTRQGDRWMIGNVLPERTRAWSTTTVGRITYHVDPRLTFDPPRARRAATFIDSLADAFDIPRLDRLDYYLTTSVDAADRALGLDSPTHFGPNGGFARPVDRLVFAGIPAWGENYRHELTHVVLLPLVRSPGATLLASEGIATWFGGSGGRQLPDAVAQLRGYLRVHPQATLNSMLGPGETPPAVLYAAGAVVCEMLFRRGSATLLKEFLAAGPQPDQLRAGLSRSLGKPWGRIEDEWRHTIDRMAAPADTPAASHLPARP